MSGHSIVLNELARLLGHSTFSITSVRVPEKDASHSEIPIADIYVIDSESAPGRVHDVVSMISKANAMARFLVLASNLNDETVFPLLRAGVKGLMTHDQISQQLGRALQAMAEGGYWVPRSLLATFVETVVIRSREAEDVRSSETEISRREKEVMDCLLQNLSNKEIASRLNISERTVKFHVSNLLSKFHVQRRADLILLWYQKGTHGSPTSPEHSSLKRIQ